MQHNSPTTKSDVDRPAVINNF